MNNEENPDCAAVCAHFFLIIFALHQSALKIIIAFYWIVPQGSRW